jgi:hypothetical protein
MNLSRSGQDIGGSSKVWQGFLAERTVKIRWNAVGRSPGKHTPERPPGCADRWPRKGPRAPGSFKASVSNRCLAGSSDRRIAAMLAKVGGVPLARRRRTLLAFLHVLSDQCQQVSVDSVS